MILCAMYASPERSRRRLCGSHRRSVEVQEFGWCLSIRCLGNYEYRSPKLWLFVGRYSLYPLLS